MRFLVELVAAFPWPFVAFGAGVGLLFVCSSAVRDAEQELLDVYDEWSPQPAKVFVLTTEERDPHFDFERGGDGGVPA